MNKQEVLDVIVPEDLHQIVKWLEVSLGQGGTVRDEIRGKGERAPLPLWIVRWRTEDRAEKREARGTQEGRVALRNI